MLRITPALAAIFIAASLFGSSGSRAQTEHGDMNHGAATTETMSAASQAYMDAMAKMNDEMDGMEMTGEAGIDFAMMMIPHHQSAIDMAKAYLESGEDDPELAKLSREIIEAQESEIAFLRAWLEKNSR